MTFDAAGVCVAKLDRASQTDRQCLSCPPNKDTEGKEGEGPGRMGAKAALTQNIKDQMHTVTHSHMHAHRHTERHTQIQICTQTHTHRSCSLAHSQTH